MIHHVSAPTFKAHEGLDLFVFGDLQQTPKDADAPKERRGVMKSGFIQEAWQQFQIEWRASKNAWGLGLGDYGDWLRPSLRPLVNGALGKDDSARQMLDNMVLKSHDDIIKSMQFLDRKLIGLHEGHHVHYLASGGNTDQRLSSALHAPFLGFSATHRLALEVPGQSRTRRTVTLISTHGNANGRKVHSALGNLADFASSWVADIYAMGHGCKSGTSSPFERNEVRREGPAGIIRTIPRLLVVGGFSRGYTDGWKSDYVERAGFQQQPIGWGLIRLRPRYRADGACRGVPEGPNRSGKYFVDIEVVSRFFTEEQDG